MDRLEGLGRCAGGVVGRTKDRDRVRGLLESLKTAGIAEIDEVGDGKTRERGPLRRRPLDSWMTSCMIGAPDVANNYSLQVDARRTALL